MILRRVASNLFSTEHGLHSTPQLCAVGQAPKLPFIPPPSGGVLPPHVPLFSPNAKGGEIRPPRRDTRPPGWKRILDFIILICTVWIWLPLMMLVLCWVKLSSPGAVIFRQRRVGFRGKEFMIFKFRTMRVNAETQVHEDYLEKLILHDAPMTKLDASDVRLVPCGKFLRATGLDELPQLFNILRGEMSLVGPRPCTVAEFKRYRPEHLDRFNAPPGITGFWQVNGKNKTTFTEMIKMDIFYTQKMSVARDLVIMWKTPLSIILQLLEASTSRPQKQRKAIPTLAPSAMANCEGTSRQ